MRFSIITITFNAEEFLEKTLDSVAAQEFSSFEHIIWDGGSTDNTLRIAEKYDAQVHQGKDGGISDAMNKGAALAKGEILLHLHADDFLPHPKVLAYVDTAFKQHNPSWLYGQAYTVDQQGEVMRESKYRPFSHRKLRRYNTITHPATYVKRTLFEEIGGFDPTLSYCMDYDLWLRLAKRATPHVLPSTIASFREHSESLSTSQPRKVADEAYSVRNRYVTSPWERYKSYCTWRKRCAST
ncbi:MAG: glycosyltransferase [Chlamydiales bacterium]|nr:glycosyltransferase [Chlamydiales bacterium]